MGVGVGVFPVSIKMYASVVAVRRGVGGGVGGDLGFRVEFEVGFGVAN